MEHVSFVPTARHRVSTVWALLAFAVAATLVLSGCATKTERKAINAAVVSGGAGWSPSRVTVDNRNKVVLTVGNTTDREHGFTIVGYDIRRVVPPGQTVEVEFEATKNGVFEIMCQLHETHQQARLVVR